MEAFAFIFALIVLTVALTHGLMLWLGIGGMAFCISYMLFNMLSPQAAIITIVVASIFAYLLWQAGAPKTNEAPR